MQPLLMSLSLCLLGFAACVLIFAAAKRGEEYPGNGDAIDPLLNDGEQFFLDDRLPPEQEPGEADEAFLRRLRTHLHHEKEAARAFLDLPSADSLHASSDSLFKPQDEGSWTGTRRISSGASARRMPTS